MLIDSKEKLRLEKVHEQMRRRCANTRRKKRSMERQEKCNKTKFYFRKNWRRKNFKNSQKEIRKYY
jgi:hypothetical protein